MLHLKPFYPPLVASKEEKEALKPKPRPALPVYLAQTSPLSPSVSTDTTLFPSVQHNLTKLKEQLAAASKDLGRDGVVVFPEYALQGILRGSETYCTAAHHLLLVIKSLARHYHLAIVLTLVEPKPSLTNVELSGLPDPFSFSPDVDAKPPSISDDGKLAWKDARVNWKAQNAKLINVAMYIDGDGEVVGRYEKRNLWHAERTYLSPGTERPPIFDTPWGRASLLICWDLSHPSAVHACTQAGAEIIFAPTYWLSTDSDPAQVLYPSPLAQVWLSKNPRYRYDKDLLESLCFSRAFEGECCLVMVNPGGTPHEVGNDAEHGFFGGSGVWMPLQGRVAVATKWDTEGGSASSVDLSVLEVARRVYRIAEDWEKSEDVTPTKGWTRREPDVALPEPQAPGS